VSNKPEVTSAFSSIKPIVQVTPRSKKSKNKTSSKLKAKGKQSVQKTVSEHIDSEGSTDLEGCEPECTIIEDSDDPDHSGSSEPKKSRSKKQKAKEHLISKMRENIPHSNGTQDHEFLNRLQFVKTAVSQDGKTSCFCGKETGLAYWIFRLPGNIFHNKLEEL